MSLNKNTTNLCFWNTELLLTNQTSIWECLENYIENNQDSKNLSGKILGRRNIEKWAPKIAQCYFSPQSFLLIHE